MSAAPYWHPVPLGLADSEGCSTLRHMLGSRLAHGYVVNLWGWCHQRRPSRVFTGALRHAHVADAADWRGRPERFAQALVAAGFATDDGQTLVVADPLAADGGQFRAPPATAEATDSAVAKKRARDAKYKAKRRNGDAKATTPATPGDDASDAKATPEPARIAMNPDTAPARARETQKKTKTETKEETLSPSVPADDRPVAYLELDPATDELRPDAPTQANLLTVQPTAKRATPKPPPAPKPLELWLRRYAELAGLTDEQMRAFAMKPIAIRYADAKKTAQRDDATLLKALDGAWLDRLWNGKPPITLLSEAAIGTGLAASMRSATATPATAPKPPSGFNAPPPSRPPPPLFVPKPLPDRTPESDAAREAHRPSFARHAPSAAPTEAQIAERAAAKRALIQQQGEGGAA